MLFTCLQGNSHNMKAENPRFQITNDKSWSVSNLTSLDKSFIKTYLNELETSDEWKERQADR